MLIAGGPSLEALIKTPVYRAMESGTIVRIEEISRCASEVQDALISILSESGSSFSTDLPIVGGMYYSLEQIMAWLIDSNDPARCKIIGDFLFKSAKKSKDIYMKPYYFKYLKQCGWNDSELAFL